MRRAPKIALLLLLVGAFVTTSAGASTPFVTAYAPLNQTVKNLLRGKFRQKVTCRDSCKVIARIFIRPQVARKLGFTGVKSEQPYAVGLKQMTLSESKPTWVPMPLGADAKKRLRNWKGTLQLTGETYASSTSSSQRGQANWITSLRH
jgi:hypothetical protein